MDEDDIIDFIDLMLEDESFEEFLERFNLTPSEVFLRLIDEGMIDTRILKELMGR
jgi:hypothetical protein